MGRRFHGSRDVWREIIEVATFRGHRRRRVKTTVRPPSVGKTVCCCANVICFGSIEEDAQRRDFTINGLCYSVAVLPCAITSAE
ncbi:hypothetical protein KCP73_07075 [Salmonella enterica subsp. enterica]|nr:hypothetical protein KCP73_07075 [Salmonella enterica subsp. enterica]